MPAAKAASYRRTGWLVLAATLAAASPVYAQSDEQLARARSEFREAIALQAAGDYAGALTKLHAVAAVRTTPQVRFNIAVCEKNLGKLTTALGSFTLAESDALDQGLAEIAEKAREHIDDIESRVPKLTIMRGEGAEAASIALDGVSLGASVIGTEMSVDPGPHTIVAKVGEKVLFTATVDLPERGTERVVVRIESLAEETGAPVESAPVLLSSREHDEPAEGGWSTRHTAWVAIGAGGASATAGIVLLVLRGGAISDLDAVCQEGRCPPSAEPIADRGKLYTGLAGATLAVGAAGLAIGGVMLFSDRAKGPEDEGVAKAANGRHLAWTVGAPGASTGASLVGRF